MFNEFWKNYPRKEKKKRSRIAFNKLSKRDQEKAIEDVKTRYTGIEKCFIPLPSSYLNDESWDDDPIPRKQENKQAYMGGESFKMYKPS